VKRRAPEIVAFLAVLYGVYLRVDELPGLAPFGAPDPGERALAAAFGIAGLVVIIPVAMHLLGRNAAALATLAIALNPLQVIASHSGWAEPLAVFACLLLVGLLRRIVDERPAPPAVYAMVVASVVAVAKVDPNAVAVVVAAGLGAFALLLRRERPPQTLLRLVASFAVAAAAVVGATLLGWAPFPAPEPAVGGIADALAFGAIDVGRVLFGSTAAAWGAILCVPLASVWMLHAGSNAAWLLVPAAGLPVALLAALSPIGSELAYARFLLAAIPFMLLIVVWAIVAFAEHVHPEPQAATRLAISLGACVFVLAHIAGPFGIDRSIDGVYAGRAGEQRSEPLIWLSRDGSGRE
jgi:hypothetical protein